MGRPSFLRRKKVTISDLDPSFKVTYLGNVLTGWAKGEGCVDKPLGTLWKNHQISDKPDIAMTVTVTSSGLKAVTAEHGLTEYWAHRITYCGTNYRYPRVFCWIYRHEGRKMKQELRCHAVLCSSDKKAKEMSERLQQRLYHAFVDFKKEKISKQNARLSLANSIYDNPSMPVRKILLYTGSSNYKPSNDKTRPGYRLKAITESEKEDDFEEEAELAQNDNKLQHNPKNCDKIYLPSSSCSNMKAFRGPVSKTFSRNDDCSPLREESTEAISISLLDSERQVLDANDISRHPNLEKDVNIETNQITDDLNTFPYDSTENEQFKRSIIITSDMLKPVGILTSESQSTLETFCEKGSLSSLSQSSTTTVLSSHSISLNLALKERTDTSDKEEFDEFQFEEDSIDDPHSNINEVEDRLSTITLSKQDTLSDESGYSEESHQTNQLSSNHRLHLTRKSDVKSGKTTIVHLNSSFNERLGSDDEEIDSIGQRDYDEGDLTVQSAMPMAHFFYPYNFRKEDFSTDDSIKI